MCLEMKTRVNNVSRIKKEAMIILYEREEQLFACLYTSFQHDNDRERLLCIPLFMSNSRPFLSDDFDW